MGRIIVVVLLLVTISLGTVPAKHAQTAEIFEISGEVLDGGNKPIDKVFVRMYRGNQEVSRDESKNGGKYSVKFPEGPTVDHVIYDHSDFNPGKVTHLSGARSHSIKKVLHKLGATVSQAEALEILAALETIFHLERANKVAADDLRNRYFGAYLKLRVRSDPIREKQYKWKYEAVGELYNFKRGGA